jgi:hypothetical protein
MTTVWLILWRYYDGSDSGVIDRAFTEEADARWLAQTLVGESAGKQYSLATVSIVGDNRDV